MESIFKETVKKAPVITAAFVFVIHIFSKILDKNIPIWMLAVIATLTFFLSVLVIYINRNKEKNHDLQITNQKISGIDTEKGDFTIGTKSPESKKLIIDKNIIKEVNTGGGDFTVGTKND